MILKKLAEEMQEMVIIVHQWDTEIIETNEELLKRTEQTAKNILSTIKEIRGKEIKKD